MSGAGSSPAGDAPSGFDAILVGTTAYPTAPAALRYEGGTRDWVQADDGNFVGVHPVEQQMAIGVLTPRGSLRSAPDVGNDVHRIRYLGGINVGAQLEDAIRNANPVKRLLDNGDAVITRIDHEVIPGGGLKYAVYFKNLRAPGAAERSVRGTI